MVAEPTASSQASLVGSVLVGDTNFDFEDGVAGGTAAVWLAGESPEVLASLDVDELWGRPPNAHAMHDDVVTECLEKRLSKGEPWRRGGVTRLLRATILRDGTPIGFMSMLLIQRPDADLSGQCRICYEGADDAGLVEGCGCRGSMKYIHAACLAMQWKSQSRPASMICGLCNQPFTASAASALAKACQRDVESRSADGVSATEAKKMLRTQISIATIAWQEGRLKEAASVLKDTISKLEEIDEPDDMHVLTAHHNLGLVLQDQGDLDGASHHIGQAGRGFARTRGEDHPLALKALHNEALLLQKRGRLADAERGYARVLEKRREKLGARHVDTLKTACNWGLIMHQLKQHGEAAASLKDTLLGLQQVVGQDHPLTLVTKQNLSLALSALDPFSEEALRLGREAAEARLQLLGEDNAETFEGWRDLALVLAGAGQRAEAERVWRQALRGQERLLGFSHSTTQKTLRQLRDALERWGDAKAAEELLQESEAGNDVSAVPLKTPAKPGPLVAVLLSLYIVEEFRGRGLGTATLQHCRTIASKLSATALEAWVPACAERQLAFLTTRGRYARLAERTLSSYTCSSIVVHLHQSL